jgi:exopolyphosphatase/guanosine-5'-triphosphate,3'-diphosphate pyrophosphatase
VERVRRSFVPDDPHAPHVTRLALRLFDQTRELHGLHDHDRELLEHAARLHSVGESLALRRQHEHGAYLVQNAELRGLSPGELATITTLVRYHRSRGISSGYPPYAAMAAWRRDRTDRMLPLLQLADALDRTRDRSVDDVTAELTDDRLALTLRGRGLHVPRLELERRAAVLERVYGVTLTVHEG